MATAPTTVYSHVVKTEGVRGGKACIDNTRIAVSDVVYSMKEGMSPEQIAEEDYPDLSLAQVYAAIAYYYDNREEIDAIHDRDNKAGEEADRQWQELLDRHGGKPPENPTPEERLISRPSSWSPKD